MHLVKNMMNRKICRFFGTLFITHVPNRLNSGLILTADFVPGLRQCLAVQCTL